MKYYFAETMISKEQDKEWYRYMVIQHFKKIERYPSAP